MINEEIFWKDCSKQVSNLKWLSVVPVEAALCFYWHSAKLLQVNKFTQRPQHTLSLCVQPRYHPLFRIQVLRPLDAYRYLLGWYELRELNLYPRCFCKVVIDECKLHRSQLGISDTILQRPHILSFESTTGELLLPCSSCSNCWDLLSFSLTFSATSAVCKVRSIWAWSKLTYHLIKYQAFFFLQHGNFLDYSLLI